MFSLLTLGRLSLHRDGQAIPGFETHRKSLTLLAVLAAERKVSRDRLMALLWPESDIERARGSLKQVLHQLRHDLDAPDLVQGSTLLSLNPAAIETDVGQFLAAMDRGDLAGAVALWAGPFLDGVHLGGSAELGQWVEVRRAELTRRWSGAVERLAADAETRGDFIRAADHWRRLQDSDPTDSRVTLRLMAALEADGRRAAALREAREYQRRLREGWDLAPDPAVAELADRLQAAPAGQPPATSPHPEKPSEAGSAEAAVAGLGRGRLLAPRPFRRVLLATAALLVVAIGAGAIRSLRAPPRASAGTRDSNLVAVAPFQVLGPALALWHEGIPDILSRDLDGAGPLRTVPQAVALRAWTGRSDRGGADRLGASTGAGIVIFGSVGRIGLDSVTLRAVLLDRTTGTTADVEARGEERRIGELADSLSVRLLRIVGRGRPLAATRRTSIAARSLPALKEFLRAEQFYRRGAHDSALAHYDMALGHDPSFALALRRMAWVLGGAGATKKGYPSRAEYLRRLEGLNRGLGPRDSLLFVSESLRRDADLTADPDSLFAILWRAKTVHEEAVHRYPEDPEIWYELGEFRYHYPPPFGAAPDSALEAFDRAIALDPGFSPSYEHAVELAFRLGDEARAGRYARAGGSIQARDRASAMRFATLMLDSGFSSPAAAAAIRAASADMLFRVGSEFFGWSTDPDHVSVALLRELGTGTHDPAGAGVFVTNPGYQARDLAAALAYRGGLREAAAQPINLPEGRRPSRRQFPDPFLDLALLGAVSESAARAEFARAFDREAPWAGPLGLLPPRRLHGLPWWFARGDTLAILAMAARAREVARGEGPPIARLRGRYLAAAAGAWFALALGDSALARQRFEGIPDTLCLVADCVPEQLTLARLLAARGEDQRAAELLDRWTRSRGPGPLAVLAHLERARLAERLGDIATARRWYRFVGEVWGRADPELQAYVAESRAGLARLVDRR